MQSRTTNYHFPYNLLGEGEYKEALRLGWIKDYQYYRYMKELGFTENQAKIAFFNTKSHLTATELVSIRIAQQFEIVMKHYDDVNAADLPSGSFDQIKANFYAGAWKIGYDKDEADKLFEANRPIPTKSDIDNMMTKEAFEPDIYTKFELNTELPEPYKQLMKSYGVPETEIEKYWITHWNNPSNYQMLDMWIRFGSHRTDHNAGVLRQMGINFADINFDEDTLAKALKLNEQAPFWLDLFKATGFRNLTVTELKLGFRHATKSISWFKGRLKDTGFSDEDADFMLDIWQREYPYGGKAPLEDSNYKKLLRGEITEADFTAKLNTAGVDTTIIAFYIKQAREYKLKLEEQRIITALKRRHSKIPMTTTQIKSAIIHSEISEARKTFIAGIIRAGETGAFTRISIRDISRGLQSGALTNAEARIKLTNLRLLDDDINTLIEIYQETQAPDN